MVIGLRENTLEEATLAKFLWMRNHVSIFLSGLTWSNMSPSSSPCLPLSHYWNFFALSTHHYLKLSSSFICLLIDDVCVPFPKSQVLYEKGLICFLHCYTPNAPNIARHIGAQATLTERMNPFYFLASLAQVELTTSFFVPPPCPL